MSDSVDVELARTLRQIDVQTQAVRENWDEEQSILTDDLRLPAEWARDTSGRPILLDLLTLRVQLVTAMANLKAATR